MPLYIWIALITLLVFDTSYAISAASRTWAWYSGIESIYIHSFRRSKGIHLTWQDLIWNKSHRSQYSACTCLLPIQKESISLIDYWRSYLITSCHRSPTTLHQKCKFKSSLVVKTHSRSFSVVKKYYAKSGWLRAGAQTCRLRSRMRSRTRASQRLKTRTSLRLNLRSRMRGSMRLRMWVTIPCCYFPHSSIH